MKRCPQCEFVYEDNQNLCDMDGSKLAFDSRPLPNLQALASPVVITTKFNWRSHVVPAMAGVVLSTVFALVYYVATHPPLPHPNNDSVAIAEQTYVAAQPAKSQTSIEATAVAATTEDPKPDKVESVAATANSDVKVESTKKETPKTKAKSATDNRKLATPPRNSEQPQKPSTNDDKKKDSKVGSLLKKTGSLIKKPFKL